MLTGWAERKKVGRGNWAEITKVGRCHWAEITVSRGHMYPRLGLPGAVYTRGAQRTT